MLKLAFYNLLRRKSRTFLSVFMIAVGVLSIIALVSLVDGLFKDVTEATGSLQGIMVMQKGGMGPMFSQMDEEYEQDIGKIQGVKSVEPIVMSIAKSVEGKSMQMEFTFMVRLIGTDFSEAKAGRAVSGVQGEIVDGRAIRSGERGKVVIGTEIRSEFSKFPGNTIKLNGEKYQVVGVYQTGSKLNNTGVLMNIDDLRDLAGFPDDKVSFLSVSVQNPAEIDRIAKLIKFKHGKKLAVMNTAQFAEALGSVIGSLRLMVFAVAAIAALVAGVGIINTMLMSTLERFKEIGSLKATGWTSSNVMKMIVIESLLIGIIGGLAGVAVGYYAAPLLEPLTGFQVYVSAELLLQAFVFAVGIGLFAGLYPAWKASRFDPIQALQME